MNFGIVLLVHTALHRAEQVARHWATGGCPVVVHVDSMVSDDRFASFQQALSDLENVRFSERFRCEWGTWGIVAASQAASDIMLKEFKDVQHVFLASGSCLPLRPISDLTKYLALHRGTDFIESATVADVPWTIGGWDQERFSLFFPFSWRRQRYLFDKCVELQRLLRVKRKVPDGLDPHIGSQWWCLTRETLSSILYAPERRHYENYFKHVWIPDESYYQTMARRFSKNVVSRSLTLSKFDYQGKPHILYDDHLELLQQSDCFVARKIWPYADSLYSKFLKHVDLPRTASEPKPVKIDRVFAKAMDRRVQGRPGLYMQSRFPNENNNQKDKSAGAYSVFEGFSELYENFEAWLAKTTQTRVHGHIFDKSRARFSDEQTIIEGALSDNAKLRDYNPQAFLTSLIWNTRGERQSFQFGPRDNQEISWWIAKDPNAQISVISGAWAVSLLRSKRDFNDIRKQAARLQRIENKHLKILRSPFAKAKIRIWTMAEFVEAPMEPLQLVMDDIGLRHSRLLSKVPKLRNLDGFAEFLQKLKNAGMHPHTMGDFYTPSNDAFATNASETKKIS